MNHLFRTYFLLFVFSILLGSCDKEKEGVPSYIHITKFQFTTVSGQGLNTSDITSAKVFVNGMEIGNFELPSTFPVLAEGDARVEIFPNIKENGLSNSQKHYKPYNFYSTQTLLLKGQVDTLKPITTYRDSVNMILNVDFESNGNSFEKSSGSNSIDSMVRLPTSATGVDQPFVGSLGCGFVKVTSDSFVVFQLNSIGSYTLPNLGRDNYIEMDFKSNVNLQVGIFIFDAGNWIPVPVMVAFPTNGQWKKIYVNLKTETSDLAANTPIKVFFGFYKDDNDTEDKILYIDNIKLLYVQ